MLARALSRIFGSPARRSLEAAAGGRRWHDNRAVPAAGVIHAGAAIVGARAQHYAINNATGARIVDSLVSNLIATGIKPRSRHASVSLAASLHRNFESYADMAVADGLSTLYALMADAVRDMVILGEALLIQDTHPWTGMPQWRRLHPEQLDRSITRNSSTGNGWIRQGVEFDATGRIAAYHLRAGAPAEELAGTVPWSISRVPASNVIHVFRRLMPGQVRGLSWFAPSLLSARELDAILDALLVRTKVAALHTGFVTDTDGQPIYEGKQSGSTLDVSLEPGAVVNLPPGKNIVFGDVPDSGPAMELATTTLRLIAAGAGTTYEQATGDYSKVNYSSARAALLEFRRFCEGIQFNILIPGLCRPMWNAFIRWQVLQGVIPASAYARDPASFETAKWLPPAWPWVDPLKDANAAAVELQNRIRSRSEIIAERGYDAEEVDREIAADRARLEALGISDTAAVQPAPKEITE